MTETISKLYVWPIDGNKALHAIKLLTHLEHWSATLHCDQFMALLVHQQFAVDAFVSLSTQTPDTVCTDGAVGPLLMKVDGERSSLQTSTDYIPGDERETVMASETCSPAGQELKCSRAIALSAPFFLLHQSINTNTNYSGPVDISFSFKYRYKSST